jgi:chemotaxis protein MotB
MLPFMSVFEPQRFEQSMSSIRGALGGEIGIPSSPHKESAHTRLRPRAVAIQTRAFNDIRVFIAQNGMESGVEALLEEASIILRLSEGRLFTPGTEQILPAGLRILNQLKELFILQSQQTINIRAYTDDAPLPPGARFQDNWELSALRAAYVLRHLLAQGIEPWRLTATGFGALEPLFPNSTEENRAKNRRIEFVLEKRLENE